MSAILLLILDRITGATGRLDSISLRMEIEGNENIWKWNIFFCRGEENGEGKGGGDIMQTKLQCDIK